jgi:hypothetical protein
MRRLNCDNIRDLLGSYLYDDFANGQRQQVTEHLEQCPTCRAEVEAQQRVLTQVQLPVPTVSEERWTQFHRDLRLRVTELETPRPRFALPKLLPWAVAVCALAMVIYLLATRPRLPQREIVVVPLPQPKSNLPIPPKDEKQGTSDKRQPEKPKSQNPKPKSKSQPSISPSPAGKSQPTPPTPPTPPTTPSGNERLVTLPLVPIGTFVTVQGTPNVRHLDAKTETPKSQTIVYMGDRIATGDADPHPSFLIPHPLRRS